MTVEEKVQKLGLLEFGVVRADEEDFKLYLLKEDYVPAYYSKHLGTTRLYSRSYLEATSIEELQQQVQPTSWE